MSKNFLKVSIAHPKNPQIPLSNRSPPCSPFLHPWNPKVQRLLQYRTNCQHLCMRVFPHFLSQLSWVTNFSIINHPFAQTLPSLWQFWKKILLGRVWKLVSLILRRNSIKKIEILFILKAKERSSNFKCNTKCQSTNPKC